MTAYDAVLGALIFVCILQAIAVSWARIRMRDNERVGARALTLVASAARLVDADADRPQVVDLLARAEALLRHLV